MFSFFKKKKVEPENIIELRLFKDGDIDVKTSIEEFDSKELAKTLAQLYVLLKVGDISSLFAASLGVWAKKDYKNKKAFVEEVTSQFERIYSDLRQQINTSIDDEDAINPSDVFKMNNTQGGMQ